MNSSFSLSTIFSNVVVVVAAFVVCVLELVNAVRDDNAVNDGEVTGANP